MIIAKQITIGILTGMLVMQATAQSSVPDALHKQYNTYRKNMPQEKIYLHSDKEVYLAGEVFWFKLYDVDAFSHTPSTVSQVAYAELLDNKNNPVLQAKIALKKGMGNGSWNLPLSLPTGNYTVRAYTNWMKNFSPDYFFEKPVTIINARSVISDDTLSQKENYSVSFYPEGGNMVNGIQSRVAFHIVDQGGKGLSCEGVLVNNAGDFLLKFSTGKFGMGQFLFTPQPGQSYTAKLTFPNGKMVKHALPAAFSDGWVMQLEQAGNKQLRVIVRSLANQPVMPVHLFVHTRNSTQLSLSSSLQNGQAIFLVDKAELGDGISCFTVFNRDRKPVCERLYFKYPEKIMTIDVQPAAAVIGPREKVNLQIAATDHLGKPVNANMSMSVYLLDSLQGIGDIDIQHYLWLNSDLTGDIESPDYYFEQNGKDKSEEIENLMLTHGWRRFRWEDITGKMRPVVEYIPEYAGHIVRGKVTETGTGRAAEGISCYLTITGSQTQFRTAVSDSAGHIAFELGRFYNDGEVIIQTNGRLDSLYTIEIYKPFSDKFSTHESPAFSLPAKYTNALASRFSSYQVQQAYTGNKQQNFLFPKVDTTAFYTNPDISYLLDNYVRFTTMEEVLREYVVPVNVRRRDGEFQLHVVDKNRNVYFETEPLVLLDGLPVFDINKIMAYDPLKVRKLDVVSRGYYLGTQSFTGIVHFITYSNNLQDFELDLNATVLDYDGLQLQREFYAPVYGTQQLKASRLPDFRTLLYWNPEVITGKTGREAVEFYSADLPGKYAVVLQGMGEDGQPGSIVHFIEVK